MAVKKRKRGGGEEEADDPLKLNLYTDPWAIKKTMTESDLNHLSRVILPTNQVENHVLPFLNPFELNHVLQTDTGLKVCVKDLDTHTTHSLSFKKWGSSGSYKLGLNWISEFVKRRMIRKGDVIGMFWDGSTTGRGFYFSILERFNAAEPIPVAATPPPDPCLCKFALKHLRLSPPVPQIMAELVPATPPPTDSYLVGTQLHLSSPVHVYSIH